MDCVKFYWSFYEAVWCSVDESFLFDICGAAKMIKLLNRRFL